MSSTALEPSDTKTAKPTEHMPGRMYTFTVVGLATFLLGIAIGYHPQTRYTVSASMLYRRPGKGGASAEKPAVIGQITTDRNLRTVAQQAGLLGTSTQSGSSADSRKTIQQLRKQIAVRTRKGEEPGQTLIELRYMGSDEGRALKVVDLLAGQIVHDGTAVAEQQEQQQKLKRQRIKTELAQAQREYADAKSALNGFVDDQLRQMQQAQEAVLQEPAADKPSLARGKEAGKPSGEARPAGTEPRHDLEKESRATMNRLKHLLDAAAGSQGGSRASPQPQPAATASSTALGKAEAAGDAKVPPSTSPPRKSRLELLVQLRASPDYHQHYESFAAAKRRYDRAQGEAKQIEQPVPPPEARMVEKAKVVQLQAGGAPRVRVMVLGLAAAIVGWWFARLARSAKGSETLSTIKEVAETLGLEVFGTIRTTDGPDLSKTKQPAVHTVRWATRVSEVALAAIVVLLICMVIVNRPFAGHLVEDPFSAYCYSIHWVAQRLIS